MSVTEDEFKQIQLPREVRAAMAASAREVDRAKDHASSLVELAATKHQLLMTQIERDYGFRFNTAKIGEDGMVNTGTKRPRPIPPEVEERIRRQQRQQSETPVTPGDGVQPAVTPEPETPKAQPDSPQKEANGAPPPAPGLELVGG